VLGFLAILKLASLPYGTVPNYFISRIRSCAYAGRKISIIWYRILRETSGVLVS